MADDPRPAAVRRAASAVLLLAAALAACSTPTPTPSATATAIHTAAPSGSQRTTEPSPTATPEPPLSLDLPPHRDTRRVRYTVAPAVPADGNGKITVTVTNLTDERVTEIVLRWPTTLGETLFLAPFAPASSRLTDALVQPWTKWVDGPGEMGEPAGTTSLGWGPLDAGATLTIPIVVTRRAPGPVAFDLQFLAGEALLTADDGGPAETRVSVP
jgi:hypothetical protein